MILSQDLSAEQTLINTMKKNLSLVEGLINKDKLLVSIS